MSYKTPDEVEALLMSPSPAFPGVGRRLREAPSRSLPANSTSNGSLEASDSQALLHAAALRRQMGWHRLPQFQAEFPTNKSSYVEIGLFEEKWSRRDRFPFPMPYRPPPLELALFRIREPEATQVALGSKSVSQYESAIADAGNGRPATHFGSLVVVLLPHLLQSPGARPSTPEAEPVLVIVRDPNRLRFLSASKALGTDSRCARCVDPKGESENQRCFAQPPMPWLEPSPTIVPVGAILFRCGPHAADVLNNAVARGFASRAGAAARLRLIGNHSAEDLKRTCGAWQVLSRMLTEELQSVGDGLASEVTGIGPTVSAQLGTPQGTSHPGGESSASDHKLVQLLERLQSVRLNSARTRVDLTGGDGSQIFEPDFVCMLSAASVTHVEAETGEIGDDALSAVCEPLDLAVSSDEDVARSGARAVAGNASPRLDHSSQASMLKPVARNSAPLRTSSPAIRLTEALASCVAGSKAKGRGHPGSTRLSPCVCRALLRDPSSPLLHIWGRTAWRQIHRLDGIGEEAPCWGESGASDGRAFFTRIAAGGNCSRSWYSGKKAPHLKHRVIDVPPVLGFDADIKDYCLDLYKPPMSLAPPDGDGACRLGKRLGMAAADDCARVAIRLSLVAAARRIQPCKHLLRASRRCPQSDGPHGANRWRSMLQQLHPNAVSSRRLRRDRTPFLAQH